ncbi:MAG: hypothetical protein DRH08_01825 [Deltaproteobacteria bacterium]|nr:MAG: hypothetical protein DRH08_01825 [Deltaproteobacteria bacterium]
MSLAYKNRKKAIARGEYKVPEAPGNRLYKPKLQLIKHHKTLVKMVKKKYGLDGVEARMQLMLMNPFAVRKSGELQHKHDRRTMQRRYESTHGLAPGVTVA